MNVAFIFDIVIIIFSAILHEVSHGLVARALGDKTAEYAGRLTLNPVAHIDVYGSIVVPLMLWVVSSGNFLFAYAKPVPYNPYNLKYQKWGPVLVALAGPATNFVLAVAMAVLIRVDVFAMGVAEFFYRVLMINVSLAIFNLVPIPPLDGSKVLLVFLPARFNRIKSILERYGMWFTLIFIFFFSRLLLYPIDFFVKMLLQ